MSNMEPTPISITLAPIPKRIITAAVDIGQDSPFEIVYQHSLFCQVVLPRSRPQNRVFKRSYRQSSIRIEAGELWDGSTWVDQPLPAGPKPRLALIHINSEAVRTRSRFIDIGNSCAEFLRRLGLNDQSGNTYTLFKREMMALAACRMTLGFTVNNEAVTLHTQPIEEFRAWIGIDENQSTLWPGSLELSQRYFDSLLDHAVPFDPRAVRALAHSAMALDAYAFLARRLHSLKKPVKVTWQQFHEQFGHEYQDVKEFKKRWVEGVRAALAVYPSAKVEQITGGLLLHPSFPPVHRLSVAVSVGLADHVRRSLPAPAVPKSLKPETIERFRNLYPHLDVYACKGDFDGWLEGKEQKPIHYDKAFLGFSKKWTKGKI
jgi:hypothetical protein